MQRQSNRPSLRQARQSWRRRPATQSQRRARKRPASASRQGRRETLGGTTQHQQQQQLLLAAAATQRCKQGSPLHWQLNAAHICCIQTLREWKCQRMLRLQMARYTHSAHVDVHQRERNATAPHLLLNAFPISDKSFEMICAIRFFFRANIWEGATAAHLCSTRVVLPYKRARRNAHH